MISTLSSTIHLLVFLIYMNLLSSHVWKSELKKGQESKFMRIVTKKECGLLREECPYFFKTGRCAVRHPSHPFSDLMVQISSNK